MQDQEPTYGNGGREVEILVDGEWLAALVWEYRAGSYEVQTFDETPARDFVLQEERIRPSTRY